VDTNTTFEWFAIQTKTGAEDAAVHTLATLGLQTFLPLVRTAASRRRRITRRFRPLFSGYCFARFQANAHLHAVRYSRGVLRVVGTEETPWPVEDSIIENIRTRLDGEGVMDLEIRRFRPGDTVRICDGPFEGWTGVFDAELDDHLRVVILLEAIQQARLVMNRDCVELAEAI
jgi:transcription termination/antitermination protein NusG